MDEIIEKLCRGRHSFRRGEAVAIGVDDKVLRAAVRAKVLWHVCHGRYGPYAAWAEASALQRHLWRLEAAAEDAHNDVAASHVSALAVYGAPTWRFSLHRVHLVRLDGRANRRTAALSQHRGVVEADDIVVHDGTAVTSVERTCLDITTLGQLEDSLVVLDWFLHRGLTTKQALAERAARFRRVPRTLHTDLAIGLADGRRESVGESRTAVLFWRHDVPAPVPQYRVCDALGRELARLDFAWPQYGVWLEFDGREKWQRALDEGLGPIALMKRERQREQLITQLTGWRCIRITWADLEHPERTAAYVRSVLAGGPLR